MNNITFAGKIQTVFGERINKGCEIIVPSLKGAGGKISAENLEQSYGAHEIAVIPPNCKYLLTDADPDDIHVVIEHATLSLKQPRIFPDVENGGIRHAAEQACAFINSDTHNKDGVLSALGNLLVCYIQTFSAEEKFSPITRTVQNEIDRRVSDTTFSLEKFLKSLPLNYDYIRKLYKKETGVTPLDYLTGKRMQLAQLFILCRVSNKYSDYTVSQLAEACGYADPLYFSRVFKKNFGVSPGEYKTRSLNK